MYHYGRPQKIPQSAKEPEKEVVKGAKTVLILGAAMLTGFFLHVLLPEQDSMAYEMPAGYTAVMSTAWEQEGSEETREMVRTPEESHHTGVEPFGYLEGEWNLWEYIGDLMASLLS